MNLQLQPTDALINELLDRFDAAIFYGIKARPTDESPLCKIRTRRYTGDRLTCIALGLGIATLVQKELDDTEEPLEPGEL